MAAVLADQPNTAVEDLIDRVPNGHVETKRKKSPQSHYGLCCVFNFAQPWRANGSRKSASGGRNGALGAHQLNLLGELLRRDPVEDVQHSRRQKAEQAGGKRQPFGLLAQRSEVESAR